MFAGVDFLLNYTFYARQDTRTPAIVGVIAVGVYFVVAWTLKGPLGFLGLVLADSAKQFAHAAIMIVLLLGTPARLHHQGILKTLAKASGAAIFMGAAAALLVRWLPAVLPGRFIGELMLLLAIGVACGALYLLALRRGLRLVLVLLIPATVALWVLAVPVIQVLFQHGAFTAADTVWTAQALHLYLFGLMFAGVDFLLNYTFYARQDTRTPAIVGVIAVGVYFVVAWALKGPLGFLGLVLADSAKQFAHAAIMIVLLLGTPARLHHQGILKTLAKVFWRGDLHGSGGSAACALAAGRTAGAFHR